MQRTTEYMTVNAIVPPLIFAEIEAHAKANCCAKAAVVRKVLTQWLDNLPAGDRLSEG
jgi:hypothetical protein